LTTRDRYEIRFDPYAFKALGKIDKADRRRVLARIERLADDPRPSGAAMLKGRHGDWRIRAGDYRVIYTIQDDMLLVLVIEMGHRSTIYR